MYCTRAVPTYGTVRICGLGFTPARVLVPYEYAYGVMPGGEGLGFRVSLYVCTRTLYVSKHRYNTWYRYGTVP